jgi:hypothetical protein
MEWTEGPDRLREIAGRRDQLRADLAAVNEELRLAVVEGIRSGWLSRLRAHQITGVSRTSIRDWLDK